MTEPAKNQRHRTGIATVLVLIISVLLLVMGLGLVNAGTQSRIRAVRIGEQSAAKFAADAGMAAGLFELKKKLSSGWDGVLAGEEQLSGGRAGFEYIVDSVGEGEFLIESTGRAGAAQRTVRAKVRYESNPSPYAVFADREISLSNSAKIETLDGKNVRVGTNSVLPGSVSLNQTSRIEGDLYIGLGGDIETVVVENSGNIKGSKLVLSQAVTMAAAMVPAELVNANSGGNITTTRTISASGKYNSIDIANKTVTISGNVSLYITGEVRLRNTSEIKINSDSSLTLYVEGNISSSQSGKWNIHTRDPMKLGIYALDGCADVEFLNTSEFHGLIYAPKSNVRLRNSMQVTGGVRAGSIEMSESATVSLFAGVFEPDGGESAIKGFRWSED